VSKWVIRLLHKIFYAFLTIFLAITLIFFIIRLTPGDPVEGILGPRATGDEILRLKIQLGLDLPITSQYFIYIKKLFIGDLGKTLFSSKDISPLLLERMKPTVILAAISIPIAAFLGTFLGFLAGINKSKYFDNLSRFISLFALSFPIFSLAPLLVFIFSVKMNWLPVSEWGDLRHMILPIITLIIPLSAVVMRVARNKYLEEVHSQWILVTRAKGLSETAIVLRLLKVCLPTILTVVSIQLSAVIAGTMITETIFDIPGMGSLLFDGIQNRDYPIVQGVILYSTIMYMIIYFFIDYINEKLDPRTQS
jgi:peptide/nickel transport system permease protein